MTAHDLRYLFEYNWWANRKYFEVIAKLTPEQYSQNVAGSYGSLRNTLVHMLSAEWGWLDRCGGPKRGAALKSDDYPTFESVREKWSHIEGQGRAFLATLTDADLDREVTYQFPGGPSHTRTLGQLLRHAANHGVHHRGQVALLLRALGLTPGNVDLLFYYEMSA